MHPKGYASDNAIAVRAVSSLELREGPPSVGVIMPAGYKEDLITHIRTIDVGSD